MNHSQWKTSRTHSLLGEQVAEAPEVAAARLEIRYARAFGQALYDRRTELELSRLDVADRAGMAQHQIAEIEGGDIVPTLPLLERLAAALEAELDIHLAPGADAEVRFHSPAA
ncbi:ribosome-binding protein aMBF1 (putative translation factor) [Kitasatospora sp. MAP12-15]|uniref:helix-turn-helix domain-containing protein n=1 Tax=unclassified Kitasatospora TaxID=2633591 RepID=UPI002476AEC4|nr:helix-turn-helix domain-containing protein [Kitasatospora sp. MAP12-44]MDH6110873.1 ribosome-binding protein aMBF1 (putative translation factor) [Kitasatospora sp. MAP12-44]